MGDARTSGVPADRLVPVRDGAAQGLEGRAVPAVSFAATTGRRVGMCLAGRGAAVVGLSAQPIVEQRAFAAR